MELDSIFMNGLYPELFTDEEMETVRSRYEDEVSRNGDDGIDIVRKAALRAALSEYTRARSHREQLQKLEEEAGKDVVTLPFLFEPRVDMSAVESLADRIEEQL
jgi:hypothetical protein